MVNCFQIPIKNKAFNKTWCVRNYYTQHTWQTINKKDQFIVQDNGQYFSLDKYRFPLID